MAETVTGQPDARKASTEDPRIGSTLAERYRVIAPIGEGGMGTVYRGVHEALRKPVAIKFLQQKIHNNREMVARFEREAVTAANLRHPNIAEAIDYGRLPDGTLYLVMEFVEGVPLRKLIVPGQSLPVERVLTILDQIATALDLAHSMGIVHRDLKPENILVFDRGNVRDVVKIIDFGIARITSEMFKTGPTALTAAGSVFGTPQYMAPEQVMGQPVDGRADQYAIGVIAFEMLTGAQPFAADSYADLVMKHVGAPAPRISEYVPQVPEAIDAAVFRMMSKLPDERFDSVTDAFRSMKGASAPLSLPTNSIPMSPNTVVMNADQLSGATAATGQMAYAATMAPGELQLPPQAVISVVMPSVVSAVTSPPMSVPVPTPAPAPAPALAPADVVRAVTTETPMAAPAPAPAPTDSGARPATTAISAMSTTAAAPASAPAPLMKMVVIGGVVAVVGIIAVFFATRASDATKEPGASTGDVAASSTSRTGATTTKTNAPSPARPMVSPTKYRLLLKDGKYPFCVTSKLKQAYPVRTNDEGVKVCVGTPDGPVPADGLKPYTPSEFSWE